MLSMHVEFLLLIQIKRKKKKNKYVNPIAVELPQYFRNINSNQELTNDENRLNIAKRYYSRNFDNLNEIPKYTEQQIINYCFNKGNPNARFALSSLPRLFLQTRLKTLTTMF